VSVTSQLTQGWWTRGSLRPGPLAIDNSPQYRGMLGNDDKRRIMKTSDSDMAVTVIGRHLMSTLFVYLVSEETPS